MAEEQRARRWRATRRRCGGCLAVFRESWARRGAAQRPPRVRRPPRESIRLQKCQGWCRSTRRPRPLLCHRSLRCESPCVLARAEFPFFTLSCFHDVILNRYLRLQYAMSKSRRRGRGRGRRSLTASRNSGVNDAQAQEKAAADREFELMDRVYAFEGMSVNCIQWCASCSSLR